MPRTVRGSGRWVRTHRLPGADSGFL